MAHRVEMLFRASHDPGEVFTVLSSRYTVLVEPSTSERWTCLDTADWRLHQAGMTLRDRRHGRSTELVLTAPDGERVVAAARPQTWPKRLEKLPPSPVRERLGSTVGIRALLAMVAVDSRTTRLRLLDEVDKTRVRVQIDQQRLVDRSHAPLPLRVVLTALRGYDRDAHRCAELLRAAMASVEGQSDAVSAALKAAGRNPGAWRSTQFPAVDPNAPAAHSVAAILLSLMDVVVANGPGVVDDVDTEYLHALRTALRAARSILTLTGDVLPDGRAEHVSGELAWLARATTPLRDLDVFLLELHGQGRLDVTGLDTALEPLVRHLKRRRTRMLRTLREALTSARATALMRDFPLALERIAASETAGPTTVVTAVASARVAYARVQRAAGPVTADTPADLLHALRRRCKRMRYLLDAFGGVYEPEAYLAVVTTLKKLQDRLGDIQDGDVQLRQLSEAATILSAGGAPIETLLAIGALQDRVGRDDRAARGDLGARLARFCRASTKAQVASLSPRVSDLSPAVPSPNSTLRQSSA
jgi:CHAD domain-containing protein